MPKMHNTKNTMPKISLKSFKTVAVALFAIAMLLPGSVAWGQNPVIGDRIVSFVRGGTPLQETVEVPGVWVPALQPWNGKFTVNGPTAVHPVSGQMEKPRIENVDTNLTFPIDPGGLNITAAEVNAYWDVVFASATRIGGPSWSQNCHGHSTGLGYWINGNGFSIVRQHDWVVCANGADVVTGCLRGNSGHTIRISGIQDYEFVRVVSETTEKMAYAGTYRYRFFLPGGGPLLPGSTYRPR